MTRTLGAAGLNSSAVQIVRFLGTVGEARMARIIAYMGSQWQTPATTTKNTVYRLAKEGRIERVGYGRYRIRSDGSLTGLDVEAPAETEPG
jgi:Mn-dependent DtxR family transcriptional regulator